MNPSRDDGTDVRLADLLKPLAGRGRQIRLGTVLVVAVVGIVALIAYAVQPVRRVTSLEFRPVFQGIDAGRYPNGLPFSPNDIIDPTVLEQVYAANGIESYCSAERFRSGFTIRLASPALRFIDLEYQARLSETRLTTVERQQLQSEYETRRAAAGRQYELQFVRWSECIRIPNAIASKVVSDMLETWARDATEKRGVTRVRVAVLSPSLVADAMNVDANLFVRADMLRRAVRRVIQNVREVEQFPGAELVRGSDRKISFIEIRADLEDLVQARLDPLVVRAGLLMGNEARVWVNQALETAKIEHNAAQKRADAYRAALRDYSGMTSAPAPATDTAQRAPADVQAITPQIDRTFIDRIIEMSAVNTTFRQDVTQDLIDASVQAVEKEAIMEQYLQLQKAFGQGGAAPPETVATSLATVGKEAGDTVRRFNEIYDEFSRFTLRSGSSLYRVDGAPYDNTIRQLSLNWIAMVILAVAIVAPLMLALLIIATFYLRRLVPARGPSATPGS